MTKMMVMMKMISLDDEDFGFKESKAQLYFGLVFMVWGIVTDDGADFHHCQFVIVT